MTNAVQNINPSILKWARERKHYLHTDVAIKFGGKSVTDEVLIEWEEGIQAPTYPQLEKLADYYKVPIAVFFFPEPPEIKDAVASLRSAPGFSVDLTSPKTLDVIHRVQSTQMALKEFNDGVNPVSSPIHKRLIVDPSDGNSVDSLVETLRGKNFLNVTLDAQLNCSDYMQALNVWRDAIEKQGIFVFRWPFKSEYLSGFCLYDEEFPVICIDSQETKGRQIFTLLHELAHLLHGKSSVTLGSDGTDAWEPDIQLHEHYFDGIAGSVLVPTDDLGMRISKGDVTSKNFYVQTAKLYKVSPRMLLVKCRLTNLISYSVFIDMKKSLDTYSGNERGDGGGDYYWNCISYWGKGFLQNIMKKRNQNRISEHEMSRILDMKINNIEKLEGYLINKQFGGV